VLLASCGGGGGDDARNGNERGASATPQRDRFNTYSDPRVQLTIRARPPVATPTRGAIIEGYVSTRDPKEMRRRLELQVDERPFGRFATEKTTRSARDGLYYFRVLPTTETRYRVVTTDDPPIRSNPVTVGFNR
jgi:hypothetical protein